MKTRMYEVSAGAFIKIIVVAKDVISATQKVLKMDTEWGKIRLREIESVSLIAEED